MASLDPRYADKARELFETYTTDFDPGSEGISFWANKFAEAGNNEDAILQEFLNPIQGAAAPRYAAMQADPDFLRATGKLVEKVASKPTEAENLFNTYATGFNPGQTGIDFWNQQIEEKGYQNALADFLTPEDPNAPRFATMQKDPDYASGLKNIANVERFRQATGQVGEENRLELDQSLRDWYNTYTGGQGMANPIEDYISMLSGRDSTNLQQDYAAAKKRMLRDAQTAGLYGGDSSGTLSYDLWAMKQNPETQARELFKTYATGFDPGEEGLEFWANKFKQPTSSYQDVVQEFLKPKDELAPRLKAMEADPQYRAAMGLMALPGAKTSIANQDVANAIAQQVATDNLASELDGDVGRVTPTSIGNRLELDAAEEDVSTGPKFEGKPYDPAAYNTVLKQLTAQQQALSSKGVPYTSTFGGASETVQDMAKRLAAMGISDIRDFGMKHELPVEKVYETIEQDEGPALTLDTGKYRTISGVKGFDAERNPVFEYRELTPDETKNLKFDESGFAFLPADQIKRSDLVNTPYATTKYYNKKTGEEIDTRQFGGKAESGLFASSGAGEGYTNYRVVYDEKTGTPIFLPEKEMSGMKEFVAKDLPGILSVLRFIPGASIPVMLAQAASAAYMGVKPEEILKKIGTTLIASNLDKIVGAGMKGLDIPMPTSDIGKLAMQGGLGGLSALIQGATPEQALKSGALSAAGSGISSLLPKSDSGIDYSRVIRALAPSIARGQLSNADLFRAISALAPSKKKAPGGP